MKKSVLFLFVFFLSFTLEAQITRTINGITLGKSSRQDVISMLGRQGVNYRTENGGLGIAAYGSFVFGQTEWQRVCYNFYNNIVYQICYEKRGNASENSTITLEYSAIRENLMRKYARYYSPLFPNDATFTDGRTNIHLGGGRPTIQQELYIWYTDAVLVKKHNEVFGF